jgi:hypothetical protein
MPPRSSRQNLRHLNEIAETQELVVSRAQLASTGFDSEAALVRVKTCRWRRVGNAFVLHSGEPTSAQVHWAAVLSAPGLAAVGGRTAAERYGLRGFASERIDIVVARGDGPPPRIDGVHWHESRRFTNADIAIGFGIPTVSRGRAIVDAAVWTPSARVACALLVASVQQRVVPTYALRTELATAGAVRHRRILWSIVADIEGGADSLSEIDFVKLARKAGLRPPIRQSIRLDANGRRRYVDADFETFQAEVDGGIHLRPLNYWDRRPAPKRPRIGRRSHLAIPEHRDPTRGRRRPHPTAAGSRGIRLTCQYLSGLITADVLTSRRSGWSDGG